MHTHNANDESQLEKFDAVELVCVHKRCGLVSAGSHFLVLSQMSGETVVHVFI